MNIFYPDLMIKSAYSLDIDLLVKNKIAGVIFDIDNTLVPYTVADCPEEAENLFLSLEQKGIAVGFISNNGAQRVERFNKGGRFYLCKAGKPSKKGAVAFAKHLGTECENLAVVGDQIFTDVWFARNSGAYSVLVEPIDTKHEPWYFVFKRAGEKIILYFYRRKHK